MVNKRIKGLDIWAELLRGLNQKGITSFISFSLFHGFVNKQLLLLLLLLLLLCCNPSPQTPTPHPLVKSEWALGKICLIPMQLLTITFGQIFELITKEIKVLLGPLACLHFSGLSLCSMLLSLRKACGGGGDRGKMKKNICMALKFELNNRLHISPALKCLKRSKS